MRKDLLLLVAVGAVMKSPLPLTAANICAQLTADENADLEVQRKNCEWLDSVLGPGGSVAAKRLLPSVWHADPNGAPGVSGLGREGGREGLADTPRG